ncbi:hypothetical protein C8Q78DRAFT_1188212 [Trametes maxima]|nr:hypothetical protein C8Q78DRAFT_1188212 [Trametes maxima]
MTSYTSTDPSGGEPRSPLFGTATFSTLSPTQTPYSSSRLSSERSLTPIGSNYDTEVSSPRQMRRILVSPSPSSRDSDTYAYSDENSLEDVAEVEAALSLMDDEIADTEDALTQWSRGSSSVGASTSYTGQYSAASSATPATYLSGDYRSLAETLLDRERRVLSTISEHTENPSRPNSFAQSGSGQGSRPNTHYSTNPGDNRRSANLDDRTSPALQSYHARAATDPSGVPSGHTPGRVVNVPGRRAGELIAFFEEKQTGSGRDSPRLLGHTRTLSAPMGPRSPAPRSPSPYTTTMSQSMSTFGHTASTTGYGYGSTTGYGTSTYGYGSRPSSPTKSRSGSSVSSSGPMSTLLSPPPRGSTSLSADSRFPPTSSGTFTQTRSGTGTFTGTGPTTSGTYTNTNTFSSTGFTTTATPTASSLRRPQTSPRSPLTSVRNIVAAWKERTPSLGKSIRSNNTSPSPTQGDGLFSLRRRAERGNARLRDRAFGGVDETGRPVEGAGYDAEMSTSGDASLSASGVLPTAFDVSELGQYANPGGTQEPLRIGLLWYLNVHASPPYRWQRCQALLYPHMLLLSWIAPGGGRGIVTLDLLNCIEVRSVPSPLHPTAQDDVGTIAARMQSESADATGQVGDIGLLETLCPFQLLYGDGIERLGAESARERVRWVSAIWEVLDRAVSIPDRSSTRSPTGSIRTIQSMSSTATSQSGSGSASTVYVPPLDELSEIQSLSGSSSLSRRPSLASAHRMRATDDAAVSSQGYLYPGDPRVIAPSRSSSLRRTSSLTDLDEEFASAVRRAREGRPGLGFGLGLAGGIPVGDGSPVTISSGPRLGTPVYMSPPPSVGRGSDKRSRGSESSSSVSDDAFFSAGSGSGSATRTPTSSFYSSSSFTRALTTTETRTGTGTGTGLVTDESIELLSGSGTNIVPSTLSYRGTASASLLGDSHDSDTLSGGLYSSTSPSRTSLTRSGARRRTPRSSRSYTTSSHPSESEEFSDKENSASYSGTYSGTFTYNSESYGSGTLTAGLSTLESYSRTTATTPTMNTRSRSITPTPSSVSYTRSSERTTESESEDLTDAATYYTAPTPVPRSPSTASFKSLSTIPSLSDYETAVICDTEYETAEKCLSERAETEYKTAAVCPTPPAETEYVTAEVCASDVSTDFQTADCRCKVPEADEISINPPSEIPTIPSSVPSPISREVELDFEPADIPLPPSTYSPSEPSEPSEHTPTERAPSPSPSPAPSSLPLSSPLPPPALSPSPLSSTESSLSFSPTPSLPLQESLPTPSTVDVSSEAPTTESIPGPSPIPPLSDITLSLTVSSPTESSVTPTPSSQLTPSVPSTIEQPTTISSSAVPESQWGAESDRSYESSMLRASPSLVSMALPEGPDTSFETSFLRPSGTPESTESSMLTPITEVSPSSPATVPSSPSSELTPTQSSLSLLPSIASPTPIPTDLPRAVTLTRTPSSVSTVSSISMSSSRMAPSEFDLDLATEPSLLSVPTTERTMRPLRSPQRAESVSPLMIPLPPSPAPPTPSASFQVSITTPRGDAPSIMSNIETIASDAPSHILTHDVNRLLQYLNDVNGARGEESREMADNIQDIKNTLEDLDGLLRQRLVPDVPPPVPRKDMSVGGSSVISSDRMSRSERSTPVGPREVIREIPRGRPREGPRIVRAISLSPPPIRLPSPDSLSDSDAMSFLSSHHSDDLSLMESVSYPMAGAASPSWPSSSPVSSPEDSPTSSPTSVPPTSATPSQLSDIGMAIPQARGLTPSPMPTPPPLSSSPSPSSLSSDTVRPVPPVALGQLREGLDAIRQQIANMLENQYATNRRLDELHDLSGRPRTPAPADHFGEFSERLRGIEDNLARLLDRARMVPPPAARTEDEGSAVESDTSSLLRHLRNVADASRARDQPTIAAPAPRHAQGPSFDEQLMEIMMSGPPPAQAPVQGPPALTPLIYRPGPRTHPRSTSPTFEPWERPSTVPLTEPIPISRTGGPARAPRPPRPPRVPVHVGAPRVEQAIPPSDTESQTEPVPVVPMPVPPAQQAAGVRPVSGVDIDFDERVRRLRGQRHPGTDGWVNTETEVLQRPTTAPPLGQDIEGTWYPPGPQEAQAESSQAAPPTMPVPPPGTAFPQPPQFVPVTAGPTIVQLPSTFNDILDLLRDNRSGQLAGLEQQSEIISYLRGLNQWLERDVHDRHAEIQSVSARLEQTRDEVIPLLNQIAQTLRREGGVPPQQTGGQTSVVVPPTVIPGQTFPTGFTPFAVDSSRPATFPHEATPSPGEPPVIPPPPQMYPGGPPGPPVIPPGDYPVTGYPPPPMPQPQPYPGQYEEDFIPPHPSDESSSRSRTPSSGSPEQQQITYIPPPVQPGVGGVMIPPPAMLPVQQPGVTVIQPPAPPQQPTVVVPPSAAPTTERRSPSPTHSYVPEEVPTHRHSPSVVEGDAGARTPPTRHGSRPSRSASHPSRPSSPRDYSDEHRVEHAPSTDQPQMITVQPPVALPPGQPPTHTVIVQPSPPLPSGVGFVPGGPGMPYPGVVPPMGVPPTNIHFEAGPSRSSSPHRSRSRTRSRTRSPPRSRSHSSPRHEAAVVTIRTGSRGSRRSRSSHSHRVPEVIHPSEHVVPGVTVIPPQQGAQPPIFIPPQQVGVPEVIGSRVASGGREERPPSHIAIHPSHEPTVVAITGPSHRSYSPHDAPSRGRHGSRSPSRHYYDDDHRRRRSHGRYDDGYGRRRSPGRYDDSYRGRRSPGHDDPYRRRRHGGRPYYSRSYSSEYDDGHRRGRRRYSPSGRVYRAPRSLERDDGGREGSPSRHGRHYGHRPPPSDDDRRRRDPRDYGDRPLPPHSPRRHHSGEYSPRPVAPSSHRRAYSPGHSAPPSHRRDHSPREGSPHSMGRSPSPRLHPVRTHQEFPVEPMVIRPSVARTPSPRPVLHPSEHPSRHPSRRHPSGVSRAPTIIGLPPGTEYPHEYASHASREPSPEQEYNVPGSPRHTVPGTRRTVLPSHPPPEVPSLRDQLSQVGDTGIPYFPQDAPTQVHPAPPEETFLPPPSEAHAPEIIPIPPPGAPAPTAPAPTIPPGSPAPAPAHPLPHPHDDAVSVRHPSGPGDLSHEQAEEERAHRFNVLHRDVEDLLDELREGEMNRDQNFRANEDDRGKIFVANEQRRDAEAQARRDAIWEQLESRLNNLPPEPALPVPPPGTEPLKDEGTAPEAEVPPPAPEVPQSIVPAISPETESLMNSMREAAARHADDIREIVEREREELKQEREHAQVERERSHTEAVAERERMHEEYQAHIRALESELSAVRKELEDEKMAREAEEAERRETERAEMLERDEAMRAQLGDVTNLVSEQRDELARKRELADQRWEVKQTRWEQKDAEDAQTRNMLQQILEGQAAMLAAQEQSKADLQEELRATQRAALEAIEQQRAAYEATIRDMAEAWRADCDQRKEETIEAVKATANEQIPYNVQGYLDEFSRSLATEVRMLLSEVGKLREDKRNLEYQIGELLQFKSKYGPGGEFDPSWKPAMTCVPTDAAQQPEPAPAPEPEPDVPQQAPSAWRSIHRGSRRSRRTQATAPPPPPPEPVPQTQSWATWQPNPAFQPSPPPLAMEHHLAPSPGSPGLFGPRSPRDSLHR